MASSALIKRRVLDAGFSSESRHPPEKQVFIEFEKYASENFASEYECVLLVRFVAGCKYRYPMKAPASCSLNRSDASFSIGDDVPSV